MKLKILCHKSKPQYEKFVKETTAKERCQMTGWQE